METTGNIFGTMIQLKNNITLYNCDNMELLMGYRDKEFDLAIIDPPYKIASQQKEGWGRELTKVAK